jgi:hypothetical protein
MSHTYSEGVQWERPLLAGCTCNQNITSSVAWICNVPPPPSKWLNNFQFLTTDSYKNPKGTLNKYISWMCIYHNLTSLTWRFKTELKIKIIEHSPSLPTFLLFHVHMEFLHAIGAVRKNVVLHSVLSSNIREYCTPLLATTVYNDYN